MPKMANWPRLLGLMRNFFSTFSRWYPLAGAYTRPLLSST